MSRWPFSPEELRAMYAGGRGNRTARRFARFWAAMFAAGLAPRRWVTLEVPGRRTGHIVRFPLGMADRDGRWYLVSMLGEHCDWVRNVRAADGAVTLRHRRRFPCHLIELPAAERAPIIKLYLDQVPGARPHIPVDRHAEIEAFEAVADLYPVFLVDTGNPRRGSRSSFTPPSTSVGTPTWRSTGRPKSTSEPGEPK